MRPAELRGYCDAVLALREEYRDRIDIHLGLEVEYYPALFPDLLAVLRQTPVEYLLLGQHALGNEADDFYTGARTTSRATLRRYVDQTAEALRTGLFTYFAHPDILNFVGDDAFYDAEMERLCRAAKDCGVPLEINLLGMSEGRNYPNERFWRIAGAVGNTAVLGCDAHRPEALNVPALEARARAMAARCGVTVADTVPLRGIGER